MVYLTIKTEDVSSEPYLQVKILPQINCDKGFWWQKLYYYWPENIKSVDNNCFFFQFESQNKMVERTVKPPSFKYIKYIQGD